MPPVIAKLADGILHDPVKIAITPPASTVELVEQSVYFVGRNAKPVLLAKLLAKPEVERALVFTRTKRGADRVAKRLAQDGIPAQAIHGNKSQGQRERTLEAFKIGHARTLVATDIAARGIDIDGITHVINYEIPNVPETYVHRIGRTGRAGASGTAISLCDDTERAYVLDIERLIRRSIPVAGHATAGHGRAADVVRKPVHRPASAPQHPARPHSAPSRSHGSSHPRGGHAPKQGGGRRHPAPHHGTPVVRERPTSHSHSKPQSHSHSSTNFGAGL
jgi:ATP-dependent RNA helicase RhlE